MRLKDFYTIPAEEKVTEKCLYRVLFSSICSILLCMICLVSTTWAWFVVSIENTGNTIEIANITASIAVTQNTETIPDNNGSYILNPGVYNISISLNQENASAGINGSQPSVYVVMTVIHEEKPEYRLFTFTDRSQEQTCRLTVNNGQAAVSFSVSWLKPASELSDGNIPLVIGAVPSNPTAGPATDPVTDPSTEATTSGETNIPSITDPTSALEEPPAPTGIPTETTDTVTEPQNTAVPPETQ